MPEISLRDLCRWDRRLRLVAAAGMPPETALDRGVSWAVSMRAMSPLLPPLRGGELVVLPPRVLDEIEQSGALTRGDLLKQLAHQPIAAILTGPSVVETPPDGVPALTLPAPFPSDAESILNRMITERRAELYRIGTELSRRLSQAALDPRGVEALLISAAELTHHQLTLQDADGNVVSAGGGTARPLAPSAVDRARAIGDGLRHLERGGAEWLIAGLSGTGRLGFLSLQATAGSITESDRLVLQQTAATCSIILGQQGLTGATDRSGRERLVADLLLGRLASSAAAVARGQSLGIESGQPVIVGLISTADGAAVARELVHQALGQRAAENIAPLAGQVGFLLAGTSVADAAVALRRSLAQRRADDIAVALSQPLPDVTRAPQGLREARFALDLRTRGALEGPVISCADIDDLGIYSLLYPLWGHPVVEHFRDALLGPLVAYEQQRSADLLRTLETYLAKGGALAEAAQVLGVHRNTLSYRLQRIADLTGRDLNDPRERLLLCVALLARNLPSPP
jgi:purine catabolism regulator